MYNILIVDDQQQIRDGLQAMLSRFPLELDGIYTAANGVEALQLLREHDIPLVITDIRMPDMDGLMLMERCKEEQLSADFLIISGYSDFAYAQRAIGLGAKGYLLKPVRREDLQTSVEHVLQEIRTRQALSQSMQQVSRRAEETDRKELCMFMQGAANDDVWMAETERQNAELWRQYRLILLREEVWINQPGTVSAHGMEAVAYGVYGKQGCLVLQQRPHLIMAADAAIAPEVLTAAIKAGGIDAVAVMTDPLHGLKELPDGYTRLMEIYRHSYLFPDRCCLQPAHIEGLEQQWQLPHEDIYALFQLIGTPGSGAIAGGISRLFHKNTLQRYHIRYTEQLCRAMVEMLEQYERVVRPYMGEEALDLESLRKLYDYPGIREYIQALQGQILRLNQYYDEFKCSYRNSQDLNEAIRYIHENYHKPLDLAMVSNHVSLNYAYFSNLFKKNTGKGFAEYLRDVRLDKARRLLADTELKIVEVADKVGYESYKSFTRAFREVMGMLPTEYRERRRRNRDGETYRDVSL